MQQLKCPSCANQTAFVTTKRKLEKITNSGELKNEGVVGAASIDFTVLAEVFKTVFNKVFGWFEENDQKYIICKSCGHYEKLD